MATAWKSGLLPRFWLPPLRTCSRRVGSVAWRAARTVALIYNWWNLFVRCADPHQPREAITSRPLLLCAVGRVVESGRQVTLRLTSTHGEAARAQALLTHLSLFLSGLKNTAEQLSPAQCWERIWARILAPLLSPVAALPGPSG